MLLLAIKFMKFGQKYQTLLKDILGKKLSVSVIPRQKCTEHLVIYPNKKMLHLSQSQPGHFATLQRILTK
jgi:hypothetical protein